jgi:pimeloyl-ACP methyl ester carboxylesterase
MRSTRACILDVAQRLPAQEDVPNQGFASVFVTAPDGLTLHVCSYGSRLASALPVVCLPSLARTAADFHLLAAALAADPAKPRLVLALDYRGHGQSEYDRNPDNYTLPVALADLSGVLIALEIAPAIFVGTSYGGLLAMMLAVRRPTAIAGVVLNDIGPVIEQRGFVRIKSYVGKLPIPRNFEEGAKFCAGSSTRSSRSSHRRSGSRLPTAPGASMAVDSCPTTI